MKDIDPDVAELLDDIPKSKLPQKLLDEGWGHYSVKQMRSAGKVPVPMSPEQAPRYLENCVQCGRPVTNARKGGGWWDHSGRRECDGAILVDPADQVWGDHVTQSWLDERNRKVHRDVEHVPQRLIDVANARIAQEKKQAAKRAAQRKAVREAPCSATKRQSACDHQCSQKGAHFGFHECKYCRHLWS